MYQIGWDEAAVDGLAMVSVLHSDRWADINSAVDFIEYRLRRYPMAFPGSCLGVCCASMSNRLESHSRSTETTSS
jgi:hypothetical protein